MPCLPSLRMFRCNNIVKTVPAVGPNIYHRLGPFPCLVLEHCCLSTSSFDFVWLFCGMVWESGRDPETGTEIGGPRGSVYTSVANIVVDA